MYKKKKSGLDLDFVLPLVTHFVISQIIQVHASQLIKFSAFVFSV